VVTIENRKIKYVFDEKIVICNYLLDTDQDFNFVVNGSTCYIGHDAVLRPCNTGHGAL